MYGILRHYKCLKGNPQHDCIIHLTLPGAISTLVHRHKLYVLHCTHVRECVYMRECVCVCVHVCVCVRTRARVCVHMGMYKNLTATSLGRCETYDTVWTLVEAVAVVVAGVAMTGGG